MKHEEERSIMPSKEKRAELFKQIHNAIIEFEEETTRALCKEALEIGIDAYDAVMEGLTRGRETVGSLYEKKEYFVPELLLCSDAMYAGLEVLRPHIKVESGRVKGKIIIGVVEGDIHDIRDKGVKSTFDSCS
jgi:methanogenic corrinoid protein MtbC1